MSDINLFICNCLTLIFFLHPVDEYTKIRIPEKKYQINTVCTSWGTRHENLRNISEAMEW